MSIDIIFYHAVPELEISIQEGIDSNFFYHLFKISIDIIFNYAVLELKISIQNEGVFYLLLLFTVITIDKYNICRFFID